MDKAIVFVVSKIQGCGRKNRVFAKKEKRKRD